MKNKLNFIFIFLILACFELNASNLSNDSRTFASEESYTLEIYLESSGGDYIGDGSMYHFKSRRPPLKLGSNFGKNNIQIYIANGYGWWFEFMGPNKELLNPGVYLNAERLPFNIRENPAMDVGGNGSGCSSIKGEFTIIDIVYDEAYRITSLALDFIQSCGKGLLNGYIRYNSDIPMPEIKNLAISLYTTNDGLIEYKEKIDVLSPSCKHGKNNIVSLSVGEYDFEFSAFPGNRLEVAEYKNAEALCLADNKPGISICKHGETCKQFNSHFDVISIEYADDGSITNLAIDFLQENEVEDLTGSIRYNSPVSLHSKSSIWDKFYFYELWDDSWEKKYDPFEDCDTEEYDYEEDEEEYVYEDIEALYKMYFDIH